MCVSEVECFFLCYVEENCRLERENDAFRAFREFVYIECVYVFVDVIKFWCVFVYV